MFRRITIDKLVQIKVQIVSFRTEACQFFIVININISLFDMNLFDNIFFVPFQNNDHVFPETNQNVTHEIIALDLFLLQ